MGKFLRRRLATLTLVAAGCAPRTGWEPSSGRACDVDDVPRVCLVSHPDRSFVMRIGETRIVPGECVLGPERRRGGTVFVTLEDENGRVRDQLILARRGRTTTIAVDPQGRLRVERQRCRRQPGDRPR